MLFPMVPRQLNLMGKKQLETSYYIVEKETKAVLHGILTIEYDGFGCQQNTSKKFSKNSKKQPEASYYIVENETKAVLHGTLTIEYDGVGC